MTVDDRIDHLRAIVSEFHAIGEEPVLAVASMVCNCCGSIVSGSLEALPTMLAGWELGDWREEADFCPRCAA